MKTQQAGRPATTSREPLWPRQPTARVRHAPIWPAAAVHTPSAPTPPVLTRNLSAALVVGGQLRPSASGALRSSSVADAVRKHARCPVLLAASTCTVLPRALPAIAEEPSPAEALAGAFESCCSLARPPTALPGSLHSMGLPTPSEPLLGAQKPCQGPMHPPHVVHLAASPASA